jgi:prepilin-type N-terminal cleavage/methylation domain-containing protein
MGHIATRRNARGATLVELLVALAVLGLVTAGIFGQLSIATQRIAAEQIKVDNFDQARDFVDQFFRDINQIGYPNGRIVTNLTAAPTFTDSRVAAGLVKISPNSIWFEGDINGTGVVQEVQYQINGSGTCALCLQRSAVAKVGGANLLTGQSAPDWGTEVNDLITPTIFTYFDANGAQITPPSAGYDIYNNGALIAAVKTIHISLTIQNNLVTDPKTGQALQTSFEGEVSLNNCSMAANSVPPMSCQ